MILFTRAQARDFRGLIGRCVSGRPRGPAPFFVIRFAGDKPGLGPAARPQERQVLSAVLLNLKQLNPGVGYRP